MAWIDMTCRLSFVNLVLINCVYIYSVKRIWTWAVLYVIRNVCKSFVVSASLALPLARVYLHACSDSSWIYKLQAWFLIWTYFILQRLLLGIQCYSKYGYGLLAWLNEILQKCWSLLCLVLSTLSLKSKIYCSYYNNWNYDLSSFVIACLFFWHWERKESSFLMELRCVQISFQW